MGSDTSVLSHSITLTGLSAGTSYSFMVHSNDGKENSVSSKVFHFTTMAESKQHQPVLSLHLPERLAGTPMITADVGESADVDRVVFYLNGVPAFTDYSIPFQWRCDTSELAEGNNTFGARAYDQSGNYSDEIKTGDLQRKFAEKLFPLHVDIYSPESGVDVLGTVVIHCEVTSDCGFKIRGWVITIDGTVLEERTEGYASFYRDVPYYRQYHWDSSTVPPGEHIFEMRFVDEHGNWGHDSIRLNVLDPPAITVEREVHRVGSSFQVTLHLSNHGGADAGNLIITDTSSGYQASEGVYILDNSSGYYGWISPGEVINYAEHFWRSSMRITRSLLRRGESVSLRYVVIPVLIDPRNMISSIIIGSELNIEYQGVALTYTPVTYATRYLIGWRDSAERRLLLSLRRTTSCSPAPPIFWQGSLPPRLVLSWGSQHDWPSTTRLFSAM